MRAAFLLSVCLAASAIAAQRSARPQATDKDAWASTFAVEPGELVATGRNPYFILEPGYQLVLEKGRVRLTVTDDGVGFDPAAPKLRARRLGLTSMEERAEALGGRLEIRSDPGAGTILVPG